jgi:hypothetical protein
MGIKCKCGSTNVFLEEKGSQKGIYCSECGKWIKWATKDEARLINHKVTTASGTIPDNYIYIKKSEYENRLNADLVAILEDLDLQIDELSFSDEEPTNITQDYIDEVRAWEYGKKGCKKLIQQKINDLKAGSEVEHGKYRVSN